MKSYSVYKITNLKTNDYYIGSTNNAIARKSEHFKLLNENRHTNWKLQSDYARYGSENFLFEVIIDGFENKQQMILKEYELINKEFEKTYNIDRICPIIGQSGGGCNEYISGKNSLYIIKKKKYKGARNKKRNIVRVSPIKTEYKNADLIIENKLKREKLQNENKKVL